MAAQAPVDHGRRRKAIRYRHPLAQVAARNDETSILDIPVDIINNTVVLPQGSGFYALRAAGKPPTRRQRSAAAFWPDTSNPTSSTPRLRLRDLVTPVDKNLDPEPNGSFIDAGASTIYRENGHRMIAIKFSVRGRDLGKSPSTRPG